MKFAESLADGIREREDKIATAAWKKAYLKAVNGTNGPPGKLRGVLLALWDLSDPMGRTWHSLRSISLQSRTPKRTVQRHLDELEHKGWVTKTPMTWAQLALEQANLDFPLPARHDEANAPVLILLTYKGKAAREEMKLRIASNSQSGHNPRPNCPDGPLAKVANDPGISVLAVHNQEVGDPERSQPPPNSLIGHLDPAESHGWRAVLNAYDQHYRRVYKGRPTSEIPMGLAKPLGGHVADLAVVLRARLHANNVTIGLEDAIGKIADKAIGAWLDSAGSDGKFLRKVGHPISELQKDLPRRVRHAVDVILAEMSPQPAPRTANVVAFTPRGIVVKPAPESQPAAERAPEPSIPEASPNPATSELGTFEDFPKAPPTGKLDPVKRADCTDAPEPRLLKASTQVPATSKRDSVKRQDCTDAPDKQTSEARKLMVRLGKPDWCDEKMALEMLHARSADVVVETVSRLQIDEKSMTRPKIYAMIFIALYGPEARNDNRC